MSGSLRQGKRILRRFHADFSMEALSHGFCGSVGTAPLVYVPLTGMNTKSLGSGTGHSTRKGLGIGIFNARVRRETNLGPRVISAHLQLHRNPYDNSPVRISMLSAGHSIFYRHKDLDCRAWSTGIMKDPWKTDRSFHGRNAMASRISSRLTETQRTEGSSGSLRAHLALSAWANRDHEYQTLNAEV